MTYPEEIYDDPYIVPPELEHTESLPTDSSAEMPGWLERHRLAVAATIGGTALASVGLVTRGAFMYRNRHKPRFA